MDNFPNRFPRRNLRKLPPKQDLTEFPFRIYFQIPLVQAMTPYRELRADDLLTMLVPQQPLYPLSKIHVPVFLQPQPGQNVAVFIVR